MSDDELLLRPRQGQMALEMAVARAQEPPWWEFAPPAEFGVAGTNRCRWCFGIFDRAERRSLAEVQALRHVLKIEMTTPFDPAICEACFHAVMASAVPAEQVMGEAPPVTPTPMGGVVNMALWKSAR